MPSCTTALLEIQIALNEDFSGISTCKYNDEIFDEIDQIFIAHLTKLPRTIYTGDEEEQMAAFNLLSGLIKALSQKNNIRLTLAHESILNKLITALIASVELDKPNHFLTEEHSIRVIDEKIDDAASLGTSTPWKIFKNLRNQLLAKTVRNICQLLSRNQHTKELILDALIKMFCANSSNCNEILVLFQYFVLDEKYENGWSSLDSTILDEILSYPHWGLGLTATSTTVLQKEEVRMYFSHMYSCYIYTYSLF